jgi:hypothetical protein
MSKTSEPRDGASFGAELGRFGAWAAFVALVGIAGLLGWQNLSLSEELDLRRESDGVAQIETERLRNQLEAERLISRGQIESLREAQSAAEVTGLTVVSLISRLADAPAASAIAVWNPITQEGVLDARKLPTLSLDQDYQLWIFDGQNPNAVDGGVFQVDPANGGQHYAFKASLPMKGATGFEVSRERKGGATKAEGPLVLSSR